MILTTPFGKAILNTYGRPVSQKEPWLSTISAFLGLQYKYPLQPTPAEKPRYPGQLSYKGSWDSNPYLWLEQIVFFVPRLLKNILKLGTEFLWNYLTAALGELSDTLDSEVMNSSSPIYAAFAFVLLIASLLLTLATYTASIIGGCLTSPLQSMRQAYLNRPIDFDNEYLNIAIGATLAAFSFLITAACYTLLAPYLMSLIVGQAIFGAAVAAFTSSAVQSFLAYPLVLALGAQSCLMGLGLAVAGLKLGLTSAGASSSLQSKEDPSHSRNGSQDEPVYFRSQDILTNIRELTQQDLENEAFEGFSVDGLGLSSDEEEEVYVHSGDKESPKGTKQHFTLHSSPSSTQFHEDESDEEDNSNVFNY